MVEASTLWATDLVLGSIKMFCDNMSTIIIVKNPVHHDRTNHIETDRHFIKEKIKTSAIYLQYIPTN